MSPIDFSRLAEKSKIINKQSDELTAAIQSINEKLNSLSLGIEVFCPHPFDVEELGRVDDVPKSRDRYLGYCKIGTQWGICVRSLIVEFDYDNDGAPCNERLVDMKSEFLLSCGRRIRVKAIDQIASLVEALEKEAERLESSVEKAKAIADSL